MLQQKIEPDEEFKGPFKRKCINLAEALLHDDWNVDWTNGLPSAEIKIVCQHKTWFSNFAAVFFRKPRGSLLAKSFSSQKSFSPCAVPVSRCTTVANHARLCIGRRNTRNSASKLLQSDLSKDDPRDVVFSRDVDDTIFVFPFS